jgi:hypothetical protein
MDDGTYAFVTNTILMVFAKQLVLFKILGLNFYLFIYLFWWYGVSTTWAMPPTHSIILFKCHLFASS